MDKLIDALLSAETALKIHNLKAVKLGNAVDTVDTARQAHLAACPHEHTLETSSYQGGGYDHCAETFYTDTCQTCGKAIKQWSESHHGRYG
jgi:hypothetical protein